MIMRERELEADEKLGKQSGVSLPVREGVRVLSVQDLGCDSRTMESSIGDVGTFADPRSWCLGESWSQALYYIAAPTLPVTLWTHVERGQKCCEAENNTRRFARGLHPPLIFVDSRTPCQSLLKREYFFLLPGHRQRIGEEYQAECDQLGEMKSTQSYRCPNVGSRESHHDSRENTQTVTRATGAF